MMMITKQIIMKINVKKLIIILFAIFVVVFVLAYVYKRATYVSVHVVTDNTLITISLTELAQFDGTDDNKPIYIGMNGYVYDVSAGRDYYKVGGAYHYLAGKDSSNELNLIGGDIIARKYKIIAKLGE